MSGKKIWVLLIGAGLVVYLVRQAGVADIFSRLALLGWGAPLVFLPFFLINVIDTWAWVCAFPPPFSKYGLSFARVFWVRVSGEAVNNFTPTAHVGGDVTRVLCLKRLNVPTTTGLVAVIMDKAALVITQILFIYTGVFLFLFEIDWEFSAKAAAASTLVLALGVIYAILLMVHKGGASRAAGWLHGRLGWEGLSRAYEKLQHLDLHLTQFMKNHRREFLQSNLWHYVGWVAGALETWTFLYLLGAPVGLVDALMIEALVNLAKGLGFFIPGSLGILEGGSVLLFQMLAMDNGLGLAFSLLKRAREAFYGLLGWAILSIWFSSGPPGEPQPRS